MIKSTSLLNKSIRSQFFKMLLFLVVSFLIIIAAFLVVVNASQNALQQKREQMYEKSMLVDELEENFNGVFFRARGYYAFQNEQELKLLYENLETFEVLLQQFSQLDLTEEERGLYNELVDFHYNYKTVTLPKALSFAKMGDYEALRELSNGGANDLVNKFITYTKSYKKKTDHSLNQIFSKTVEQGQLFTFISLMISGLIFLFVGVILRRVLNNMIRPIEQLTLATNALASGKSIDLGNLVQKEDELGILANSFLKMIHSIQDKEEVLTTQNEELLAQQDELQENQLQLQNSLNYLEKYNQLNHVLTFTLNKQKLIDNLHNYLNDIYQYDTSVLYWMEGNVYATKGLSHQSAAALVENFDMDKQARLKQEKSFVIKRQLTANEKGIAQESYYAYDLYSSVFNSKRELVAILMATREGHPHNDRDIDSLNGLLNRVSIAFERILMYEEVEKSRTLNQTIIDNVNEGIQLVSVTGDTILINRALCGIVNFFNLTTETSIPKEDWLQHFQKCSAQPDELIEFLEASIMESFEDTRKYRYCMTAEHEIFVEVYATCLFDGQEKVGTIFVHRDITREYEVDQMKSELVSTVSHELRTPLSSVLGFTELLLTKNIKPERQNKYIDTIHREAVRLTNLINDFLDLQRMESGKQQYNMETLQLNEIAFEIVNRFRHEQKHNVHLIDKAREVYVNADQDRLVQLFINLIGNAIKFSPQGGDVEILLENKNNSIQVSIKDEGIGISKQDIAQLFQKFKRIDNSLRRKIGGTGLGLSICREIILKHEGEIWIESEEGQGTIVYFTLPLANNTVTFDEEDVMEDSNGLNIMIVEDDLSLALLLSEELKSKGFTVIHHHDPKKAFEDTLNTPLLGIVIDIMLGEEMSGWDLVRALREREHTKEIPIIISSALDEVKEMVDQFQIKKYLTKPYPPEEISKLFVK